MRQIMLQVNTGKQETSAQLRGVQGDFKAVRNEHAAQKDRNPKR